MFPHAIFRPLALFYSNLSTACKHFLWIYFLSVFLKIASALSAARSDLVAADSDRDAALLALDAAESAEDAADSALLAAAFAFDAAESALDAASRAARVASSTAFLSTPRFGCVWLKGAQPKADKARMAGAYLRKDAKQIQQWLKEEKDVYIYFNNDVHGWAVENALTL